MLGTIGGNLIPAAMLLGSYAIVYRLPSEMTIPAWLSLGGAVVLFCIGYFTLTAQLPEDGGDALSIARNALFAVMAAGSVGLGVWRVYEQGGTEGSIAAATLLLIEGLAIYHSIDERLTRSKPGKIILRVLAVGMIALGVWLFALYVMDESGGEGLVAAATVLWILGIVLLKFY